MQRVSSQLTIVLRIVLPTVWFTSITVHRDFIGMGGTGVRLDYLAIPLSGWACCSSWALALPLSNYCSCVFTGLIWMVSLSTSAITSKRTNILFRKSNPSVIPTHCLGAYFRITLKVEGIIWKEYLFPGEPGALGGFSEGKSRTN